MFRRPLVLMSVLAAAVGVPYVALDEQVKALVKAQLARWTSDAKTSEADPLAKIDGLLKPTAAAAGPAAADASTTTAATAKSGTVPLEESIRFDVTPEWVVSRWPQVSSVIGDSEHVGLRVMLVSGTTPTDVAGALTYYFNQQHQVERLTLNGVTGEPSRLVNYTVGKFGLRPMQPKEQGLSYGGDANARANLLKVVPLPVVRPDAPLARVEVTLDLRRPDAARITSEEGQPTKALSGSYRRW